MLWDILRQCRQHDRASLDAVVFHVSSLSHQSNDTSYAVRAQIATVIENTLPCEYRQHATIFLALSPTFPRKQ